MKEENLKLGFQIANKINKKNGIITYSGTLAIELALICLKLKPNSNILISSTVCYSIANTIKKLNLNPIIVIPKDNLILTDEEIDKVLSKTRIDCIILVHQYGILNKIDKLKYKNKNIKIIEDIAQAWNIGGKEYNIGENNDIVVTSFGKTKPLSYGIGGGLFFDNDEYMSLFDFCDNETRAKENITISYLYPLCKKINIKRLERKANIIINQQKLMAKKYYKKFKKINYINTLSRECNGTNIWHRYPIWFYDKEKYELFISIADKINLKYQLPHEIPLEKLPKYSNSQKINFSKNEKYFILLRTRNINLYTQLKKITKIIYKIEKKTKVCYNKSALEQLYQKEVIK